MRLRIRLLASMFLTAMIPIAVMTILTYSQYTKLIREQTAQVADGNFSQAAEELNASLESINRIYQMFMMYTDDNVSMLDDIEKYADAGAGDYDAFSIFQSNRRFQFICQSAFYFNEYVNGVFFFTPSGVTLGYGDGGNTDVYYGYDPRADDWYEKTLALSGGVYIDGISSKHYFVGAKPSVSFCRVVYNPVSRKFLGVLMVDCAPGIFDLTEVNALPELIRLTVEDARSGSTLIASQDAHPDPAGADINGFERKEITLRYENLVLAMSVDYSWQDSQFNATRQTLMFIACFAMTTVVVISAAFSNSLARPITHLSGKMADRGGHNQITNQKYLRRRDEVGILCNEYNTLLDELQRIIANEYQNRLVMLDAQMRSLEAQIDSHFLYNTLESINSIAEIEKVGSIATISLALGNMFRYSIKTESELVSIADELEHVQNFVSIQKIRFDNAFSLVLDLTSTLSEMKVLKLILQPLVENALKHGLKNCQKGDIIRIIGRLDEKNITLRVEDNGAGMPGEQLHALRGELSREPRFPELGRRDARGIGLKNIHSRIELYYGKGYGLSIDSSLGKGTSVTILVPRQRAQAR